MIGLVACSLTGMAADAQRSGEGLGSGAPSWQKGYTLVLSDVSTPAALHKTVAVIQSVGGRVGVISEPDIVFCWVPSAQHQALLREGVLGVFSGPTPLSAFEGLSERTVAAARFYNEVISGEYFERASPVRPDSSPSEAIPPEGDALAAGYLNDGMEGYVNVAMLFIESVYDPNVAGSEDLFTWDQQSFWAVYNETWAALSRWSSMASTYGKTLYFSLGAGYPWANTVLQQPYEPIRHRWFDHNMWLEPVMAGFGYTQGDGKARVLAWNEWRRQASGAAHATTFVMVKNDASMPRFTDGQTSRTYLGGPFVQMVSLYAAGSGAEQAHEFGHIFWACDEYARSGCVCQGSCTTTGPRRLVPICNCANAPCTGQVTCVMDLPAASVVCPSTAQKIGWVPPLTYCQ